MKVESHNTRENLKLILENKVDYAMISLVDYFRNKEFLKLIHGPTITGLRHSMSNLLISKGEDPVDNMRIAVTEQTETTAFFLRLVLDKTFRDSKLIRSREHTYDKLLAEENYALLIGDSALSVYETSLRIIYDVTHMFTTLYGLYSIYAVTVSNRKSTVPSEFPEDFNVMPWEKRRMAAKTQTGVSNGILERYFDVISYNFDSVLESHIGKLENLYKQNSDRIFSS